MFKSVSNMSSISERPRITYEQIIEILRNKNQKNNYEILDYSMDSLDERAGFLGDHGLLKLTVRDKQIAEQQRELRFFVKLFPSAPTVAEFAIDIGAFDKEVFIYDLFEQIHNKGVTLLEQCVAKCYYKNPKEFLIMDNLTDNGYQTLNKYETLNYDNIIVVLAALSKLHASSLIYEEQMSDELAKSYRLNEHYDFSESFFCDRKGFVNRIETEAAITGVLNCIEIFGFPKQLASGKNFRDVLKQVCYQIYEIVKPSDNYRNIITHGDMWATNFLIKYDNNRPVDCKFVDFQFARYTPPAQDLLALFYLTTSREFRKRHMYNLIGYYYNCLEKNLACFGRDLTKIISFNEFLNSCEDQKLFGLVQTATYLPLILLPSSDVMKYFTDEEIYKKFFLEDRSHIVLEHMDKDENYKKRIVDSLHDLKDYCDYL